MREIATFQDAVEHLLDVFDLEGSERQRRLARSSIVDALRDIVGHMSWSWYNRELIVHLQAPYSTGTVAYDHTGGTYERQLTLTTGSWPTWAASGTVTIDDVQYGVERRVSSSVIVLQENSNPGADVTAGTTYQITQSSYSLPSDFHSVIEAYDLDSGAEFTIDSSRPFLVDSLNAGISPGQPIRGVVYSDGGVFGAQRLMVYPPPSSARKIKISYLALPRELLTEFEQSGTVSGSSAGTTLTGTSTVFTSAHKGCVIRLSSDGVSSPTNSAGYRTVNKANPFAYQGIITYVASETSIVVSEALPSAFSSVCYSISDPLDVAQDSMLGALYRSAEKRMASKCGATPQAIAQRERDEFKAIREAAEKDNRFRTSNRNHVATVRATYTDGA